MLVAPGTYTGTGNINIDFKGKAITLQSQNGAEVTIIDCQNAEGTFGVSFQNRETVASVLDGFTIQNANYSLEGGGHGIISTGSSPTITNCIIRGNKAKDGGGIYCALGSPAITNCIIVDNSTFGVGSDGGGIYCVQSSPTITDCTIRGNTGGGIACSSASPTITDCIITENTHDSRGGGINCWESSPTIANCIITQNTASDGGGIACVSSSSPTITNCTISGNSITASGGGIYCLDNSSPTLINCLISRNSSPGNDLRFGGGSGVGCVDSSPTITNCTIADNISELHAGGIYSSDNAFPLVQNSILWGNSGNEVYLGDNTAGVIVSFSNVQGGKEAFAGNATASANSTYEHNINADPFFVDATNGNYALTDLSPCIGIGTAISAPEDDIEGSPRSTIRPDMGAYEHPSDAPLSQLLTVNPSPIAFGDVFVGEPTWMRLVIGNPSGIDLKDASITSNLGGMALLELSETMFPIAPRTRQHELNISLTAIAPGEINGSLSITGSQPDFQMVLDISANALLKEYQTIYVSTTGSDDNNGFALTSAKATIQAGIDTVANGGTVLVSSGTYRGLGNRDLDFKGKAIKVKSLYGAVATIIDCQAQAAGFIFQSREDASSVLDGFTITKAQGTHPNRGGVICLDTASPTITNCIITRNTGSGISCREASPTVTNCTITYNQASFGAGINCQVDSAPSVTNCVIANNTATSGGGISCTRSSPTVTNCTITENRATRQGGGINTSDSSFPIIKNTILWGNSLDTGGISEVYVGVGSPILIFSDVQGGLARVKGPNSDKLIYENNLDADPLFVDWRGDYRLSVGSPCLSTGTVDGAPSTDIEGRFRPLGSGVDIGAYEHLDDASLPQSSVVVDLATLAFGEITVGEPKQLILGTDNTSLAPLRVTQVTSNLGDEAELEISETVFTVAPDATHFIALDLTASEVGDILGTLTITSNDPDSPTEIAITANAQLPAPKITISPLAIDFGDLVVGGAATQEITVTNTSDADVEVTDITSTLGDIVTISETAFTVAPGATHDITLTLTPSAAGAITGTLTITSNDAISPTEIAITGDVRAAVIETLAYEMELGEGVNLISVPLDPSTEWRLSDLADHIGSAVSFIAWYDPAANRFVSYFPDFPEDSPANKPVSGGDSYIVVMAEPATVTFTGRGWNNTTPVAPALHQTGTPVLVIDGVLFSDETDQLLNGARVVIRNQRTGAVAEALTGALGASGTYTVTFASFTGQSVADFGDWIEIEISDHDGTSMMEPITYHLTADALRINRLTLDPLWVAPIPKKFALFNNYPNPFNPETWIPYQLPERIEVSIGIYAPSGQLIRNLKLGEQPAGTYLSRAKAAYWEGNNSLGETVTSGVYFYVLKAGSFSATKKMVILK